MCDPITLGLGLALSTAGGMWGRHDQLSNAEREANARNGVLSGALGNLGQIYSNTNAPAFSGAVGAIDPANLGKAQAARTATVAGNVAPPTMSGQPAPPSDAPPALASGRAAAMKNAFNSVNNQANATGKLGGYGDQWFNSNLAQQDAARKVGIGNLFANETKSLIGPEQDLAAASAYKTPSPFPGLMQGLGSIFGAASGGKGGGLGGIFSRIGQGGSTGGTPMPDLTGGF